MNEPRFRMAPASALHPLRRAAAICAAALVLLCPALSHAAGAIKAAVAADRKSVV